MSCIASFTEWYQWYSKIPKDLDILTVKKQKKPFAKLAGFYFWSAKVIYFLNQFVTHVHVYKWYSTTAVHVRLILCIYGLIDMSSNHIIIFFYSNNIFFICVIENYFILHLPQAGILTRRKIWCLHSTCYCAVWTMYTDDSYSKSPQVNINYI